MGATSRTPLSRSRKTEVIPLREKDGPEVQQLYDAIRQGKTKLVSTDGEARILPNSLRSFLVTLTDLIKQRKGVYIVQSDATLTTMEAATMLGVSRQFLVNQLEKGEIPHHLVGSHRRMYAEDVLRYKSKRDAHRRKTLDELARAEAAEGIYDRIPHSESK